METKFVWKIFVLLFLVTGRLDQTDFSQMGLQKDTDLLGWYRVTREQGSTNCLVSLGNSALPRLDFVLERSRQMGCYMSCYELGELKVLPLLSCLLQTLEFAALFRSPMGILSISGMAPALCP